MPPLVLAGISAAALAALAEAVVFRPFDRPLEAGAGQVRTIAASFVGGQAVLGLVVAILAAFLGVRTLAFPVEPVLPVLLGAGAFGVAFAFRAAARREPFTAADRARTIVSMAMAQGVGIMGAVVAFLALFLGE